jgi:hypothetical protein
VVSVPPGASRAYVEDEWRDAVVYVERGAIELRDGYGNRRRFDVGSVLWLVGLSLRTLHNPGAEEAVLVAVSRRR